MSKPPKVTKYITDIKWIIKIPELFWFITSTRWNNTQTLSWLMAGREHVVHLQEIWAWTSCKNPTYQLGCSTWSEVKYWSCGHFAFCRAKPSYFARACKKQTSEIKDKWYVSAFATCNAVKMYEMYDLYDNSMESCIIFSVAQSIQTNT